LTSLRRIGQNQSIAARQNPHAVSLLPEEVRAHCFARAHPELSEETEGDEIMTSFWLKFAISEAITVAQAFAASTTNEKLKVALDALIAAGQAVLAEL
jgi:hypothetical protein